MNYSRLIIISLIIFSSCKKEVRLTFSSEVFTEENLEICRNEKCSTVTIDYLMAVGDNAVSEKINSEIKNYVIEGLFLGDDDKPSAKDIHEAATQFVMAYRDHQPDLPSELDPGGYEAEIIIENTYQTESLLCLRCSKYLFTGGAHGYGGTTFLLFNAETGAELDLRSLITDYKGFEEYIETQFRIANKIPESGSINATGFWFENDKFHLSEAVGFEDGQLLLIYNPYEITSYAEGPISLEIPISEIESYLKNDLL